MDSSRRNLLCGLGGLALASALPKFSTPVQAAESQKQKAEAPTSGRLATKVVDCEYHYYLPELFKYLAGRKTPPMIDTKTKKLIYRDGGLFIPLDIKVNTNLLGDDLIDFGDARVAEMDKAGIDVAVISSSTGVEELPKKESVYFAQKGNDAVADLIKRYPGRFIGTAALPTPYVDEAIKELTRCKEKLGFKYWHTHSNYNKEHLYQDKFLPLLAKSEELGFAFYLHPHFSNDKDLTGEGWILSGSPLGFGIDTMKTAARLIVNGTFDRFPKLRMVLGHLGEYFPFILDRIDNRVATFRDSTVKMLHPISYYFKNKNILVTTSGNMSKEAFKCAYDVLGVDNIIFGSDYPYENMEATFNFFRSLNLSQEDREKIFHLNAEKYLL